MPTSPGISCSTSLICTSLYMSSICFSQTVSWKTSHRYFKESPYACRTAVFPTRSHWGSRSSLLSRTVYVPLRRWSAPCCALWSSPPPCWHGQVCRDPRRCQWSRLQWEITRHGVMTTRQWRCHLPKLSMRACLPMDHLKLLRKGFTTQHSLLSSRMND